MASELVCFTESEIWYISWVGWGFSSSEDILKTLMIMSFPPCVRPRACRWSAARGTCWRLSSRRRWSAGSILPRTRAESWRLSVWSWTPSWTSWNTSRDKGWCSLLHPPPPPVRAHSHTRLRLVITWWHDQCLQVKWRVQCFFSWLNVDNISCLTWETQRYRITESRVSVNKKKQNVE